MPGKRSWKNRRGGGFPTILVVVATVAALGMIALAVAGVRGRKADSAGAGTLDRYTVARRAFDIMTTASGELGARRQVEVRSQLESSSTIVEIVSEGAMVKAGDVLVRLNADQLKNEIAEEELRVETARSELVAAREAREIQASENESALRQAELAVEIADLSYQQWLQGEFEQTKQDLLLALTTAQKEFDRLNDRFSRSRQLLEEGFYSKDQLEKDKIELDRAEAELEKARLAQQIYHAYQEPKDRQQKTADKTEARAELERVRRENASYLASKEADLLNKQRQFELRASKLADLNRQLAASTITAPSDGLVVYSTSMDRGWRDDDGPWQIGSNVHPNELIIILPDTNEMIASVQVHESLVSRIRSGQRATVKIDALGGRVFPGEVLDIGVLAETGGWRDPNRREYTVRIALATSDDEEARMKPSMRCDAEIIMGRVDDALAVPIQAVFSEGPLQYVFVPDGAKFTKRPVRVGRRSEQMAEIAAGLDEGDRVLLRQPDAGEVLAEEYTQQELAAVGLQRNEDGKLERIGGGAGGSGGGPDRAAGERRGPGTDERRARGEPTGEGAAQPAAARPMDEGEAEAPSSEPAEESPAGEITSSERVDDSVQEADGTADAPDESVETPAGS